MGREVGRWRALASLGFVLAVLALAGFGVAQVARRQWRLRDTFRVRAEFATIGGVGVGQRVRIQGIDAGVVESIAPPQAPGKPVRLVFRVDARLRPLVRADAVARIASEGVVGSKVVEIVPGRPDAPPIADLGTITSERTPEMADLLKDATAALKRVDAVASAAEAGLGEINAIASAIRKGEGTLGRLVRDDEAYRSLMAISRRGERTLTDLEENLAAMKRTWPLSRYFNDRAFYDRDRLLFHPGAEREGQVLHAADLFEPGRSVLTASGRARLDEVAAWFRKVRRPTSEVVIAAFTDDPGDPDLAQILTQEQADSVRKYLVDRHAIGSVGWFGTRKVASVGFGVQAPRTLAENSPQAPPRRVEIILFTPQT